MRRKLRASGSRPATRADHTTLSEYPAGRGGLPGPDIDEYQDITAIAVWAGLFDLCLTSLSRDRVSCRGEAQASCRECRQPCLTGHQSPQSLRSAPRMARDVPVGEETDLGIAEMCGPASTDTVGAVRFDPAYSMTLIRYSFSGSS